MMTTTAFASYAGPSTTRSTAELLVAAGKGTTSAWEEIIRRYGNLVAATVRSFRLQEADALDAMQTTWLRLAENVHRVQSPEHLGGWLATTARRECLRILRHQAKHTPNPMDAVAEEVVDSSVGAEQRAIDADTARTLWNLVAELPPRRRTLIRTLFADTPHPYAQIARTTGIPPGGIGPTRARALQQLRQRLDEHGLGQ